jgi:malonyl-CoA O-methyltransferase
MNTELNLIPKNAISQSFSLAAHSYDKHAFVQQEIAKRLLERLDYIQINPKNILDLGAGTGYITKELAIRFPQANIISLDLSYSMLSYAKNNQQASTAYLCNDAETLAIKDTCIDFIFSNCTFQWVQNLPGLFKEITRTLTEDGILLFSTFGPDTLIELKKCFAKIDNYKHVNNFVDLHTIGDLMLNCKLTNPVVDMEKILFQYENLPNILNTLKKTGATNLDLNRNKGCFTKSLIKKLSTEYNNYAISSKLPVTFEVIYGHAWGNTSRSENFYFNINNIKKL